MRIAKTSSVDSATPLLPGARVPYRVALTSDGSGDDADASVIDYLDEGVLDDADLDPASIRTSHGSAAVDESTGRIAWSAGTLPVGTTAELAFDVVVTGSGDGALTNTACLAGVPFEPAESGTGTDANPCATVSHIVGSGGLLLRKTASQESAEHGGTAGFDIVVANTGSIDAVNVAITDVPTLDHLLEPTIDNGAGGTQPATEPVGGLNIPAGGQVSLHVSGRVADGFDAMTVPNRVAITQQPEGFDPPTIENACADDAGFSCAEIPVPAVQGRLSIDKTAVEETVDHGERAGFHVVVANEGARPAEGVTLTDVPELEHLTEVTISQDGGPASSDLSVENLSLAPGASTTFTVTGRVTEGVDAWTIPNRVRLDGVPDGFEPTSVAHPCNDDASASCARVAVPPIGVVPTVLASTAALASTGVPVGPLAGGAAALLLAGGALTAVRRRSRSTQTH